MKKITITKADIFVILTFLSAFGGLAAAKHGHEVLGKCGFVGVFLFLLIGWIVTVFPRKPVMLLCARCSREQLKSSVKFKRDYCESRFWQCPTCGTINQLPSRRLRNLHGPRSMA